MSNIVKGTMLLTGATFLSKFLGMIYIIPFNMLIDDPNGITLFAYGYTPYNILITISTIGVPLAVSKFVSKYNALEDYQTGLRIFRIGIILMSITGFLAFLILFFGAEFIAELTKANSQGQATGNNISVAEITMVLRMVSFALIIIPAMSIVRGFFQGHQSMGPTAVSQVVEQIVRIVFLLSAVFIIIVMLNGETATAIGFATFAAFIGALASCVVLYVYWRKRKPAIDRRAEQQLKASTIPTKELVKELFQYAGPFVLIGIATPLYQIIDQITFERAMKAIGQGDIVGLAYGAINFNAHKLVIIPVAIATGLSAAILPALTKSFNEQTKTVLFKQINQALQIVIVLIVPAVVGLSMLSDLAYGSLFGMNNLEITGPLLGWYAPVGLLFGLFLVTSSILQGINQQRFAVISLSGGLLIKILFNIQLIHMFGAKGMIFGTALAVGTAVTLNLWRIHTSIQFSFKQLFKRTLLVCIFSIIMVVILWLTKLLFGTFIPYEETRWGSVVMLIIGVTFGGSVYLWFAYHSTLLQRVLGNKVRVLDRIFKR
ncbi:putative polysaccharide biosynthesis protein [Virgibacillus necropolis]|uniref:Cell division protein n=1 Tax=Virgibacillus necropolis TaxID=163877 RepID=A0A221MBD3_9BACI|nr:polysaccharide biosynthesis protein [Virgibacillus necropolis]ASN04937.1 cell division protein [Virgibacillus necropolis]